MCHRSRDECENRASRCQTDLMRSTGITIVSVTYCMIRVGVCLRIARCSAPSLSRLRRQTHTGPFEPAVTASSLDVRIADLLRQTSVDAVDQTAHSRSSYEKYRAHSGTVLDHVLPYEAYPSASRRAGHRSTGDEVVLVIHAVDGDEVTNHVVSSGFIVQTEEGDRYVVSCAHTLEQVSGMTPCFWTAMTAHSSIRSSTADPA